MTKDISCLKKRDTSRDGRASWDIRHALGMPIGRLMPQDAGSVTDWAERAIERLCLRKVNQHVGPVSFVRWPPTSNRCCPRK